MGRGIGMRSVAGRHAVEVNDRNPEDSQALAEELGGGSTADRPRAAAPRAAARKRGSHAGRSAEAPRRRLRHPSEASLGVTTLAPTEVEVAQPSEFDEPEHDRPWVVIVWNDPINLMSYVTLVFQKLFGYTLEHATKLMLQVHYEGKSVVAAGTREKAELDVARLHAYGLWATMQQD
jgi:ATP-dependent Clp protease adaptor protein ClpS